MIGLHEFTMSTEPLFLLSSLLLSLNRLSLFSRGLLKFFCRGIAGHQLSLKVHDAVGFKTEPFPLQLLTVNLLGQLVFEMSFQCFLCGLRCCKPYSAVRVIDPCHLLHPTVQIQEVVFDAASCQEVHSKQDKLAWSRLGVFF